MRNIVTLALLGALVLPSLCDAKGMYCTRHPSSSACSYRDVDIKVSPEVEAWWAGLSEEEKRVEMQRIREAYAKIVNADADRQYQKEIEQINRTFWHGLWFVGALLLLLALGVAFLTTPPPDRQPR